MRGLLLTILAGGLLAGPAGAAPLDGFRGSKRVLLVFSSGDPALDAEQKAELAAARPSELSERDLLVLQVPPDGTASVLFGKGAGTLDAAALRKACHVAADAPFTTLLVGKDGGTKWREERPARTDELFRLIDSMPMRVREMRKG